MTIPRTASQNARRSRSKGHAFERDVARILAPLYPDEDVRRCIAQSRTAKREGCDVEGTPWFVECKVGARGTISLDAALAQAERDSDGRPALVVAKEDRMDAVVYARLDALASLGTWGYGAARARAAGAPDSPARPPVVLTLARFVELVRS